MISCYPIFQMPKGIPYMSEVIKRPLNARGEERPLRPNRARFRTQAAFDRRFAEYEAQMKLWESEDVVVEAPPKKPTYAEIVTEQNIMAFLARYGATGGGGTRGSIDNVDFPICCGAEILTNMYNNGTYPLVKQRPGKDAPFGDRALFDLIQPPTWGEQPCLSRDERPEGAWDQELLQNTIWKKSMRLARDRAYNNGRGMIICITNEEEQENGVPELLIEAGWTEVFSAYNRNHDDYEPLRLWAVDLNDKRTQERTRVFGG